MPRAHRTGSARLEIRLGKIQRAPVSAYSVGKPADARPGPANKAQPLALPVALPARSLSSTLLRKSGTACSLPCSSRLKPPLTARPVSSLQTPVSSEMLGKLPCSRASAGASGRKLGRKRLSSLPSTTGAGVSSPPRPPTKPCDASRKVCARPGQN